MQPDASVASGVISFSVRFSVFFNEPFLELQVQLEFLYQDEPTVGASV